MSDELPALDDFCGTARLFPLPNLVLFPHVAQPLHIFEPRYRQLMADALDDDRLIAMALLRPGWEEDYDKRPPIHPMVCLGRILQEQRLADGRYNLLLHGLSRARVVEEPPTGKLYRVARVELVQDVAVGSAAREAALREGLGQGVTPFFAAQSAAAEQLQRLLESGLPLGTLCDIFAFALPLGPEVKQRLLDEAGVEPRVRLLLDRASPRRRAPLGVPSRRSSARTNPRTRCCGPIVVSRDPKGSAWQTRSPSGRG
jgi:Lon protease-like protein